jgi:hypothetical protein
VKVPRSAMVAQDWWRSSSTGQEAVGDVDKWVSELMESQGASFVLSNWEKYLLHKNISQTE